jgi:hypothetical protein
MILPTFLATAVIGKHLIRQPVAAFGKAVLELALPDRLDGSKCAD